MTINECLKEKDTLWYEASERSVNNNIDELYIAELKEKTMNFLSSYENSCKNSEDNDIIFNTFVKTTIADSFLTKEVFYKTIESDIDEISKSNSVKPIFKIVNKYTNLMIVYLLGTVVVNDRSSIAVNY